MNIVALKEKLADPAYEGVSDSAVASAINALCITRVRLVPTWEVKKHAIENGYWPAIIIAAEVANTNVTVRGLAMCARDWIDDVSGKIEHIDFTLTSTQNLVNGLVSAGIVTQAQVDSLVALKYETVPWTTANGLPEIGIGLVINARKA